MKLALRVFISLVFLMSLVVFKSSAFAQLIKLRTGYSGTAGEQLPLWIAKETGIFEKNGLDVQLIYITGGSIVLMALISGNVPISQLSGTGVISSVLAGSDAVVVAGGITSLSYALMGAPNIKSPQQLKGGIVAISRFGGASDFTARYALEKIGINPSKDVSYVQIGGSNDRLLALETGRVQAAPFDPPIRFIAEKKGMSMLADVAKLGLVIQHTSVASTRKFVKEHPDVIRRYVKSQVEAVHRIYTDKEATIKTLSKYIGISVDRDVLERTRETFINEQVLSKKQYPSLEGIKMVLSQLADTNPKARAAQPEAFADLSFVRELDQSGYIDALYKQSR